MVIAHINTCSTFAPSYSLKMVPPFVTLHMLCGSRFLGDIRVSSGVWVLIQWYFCVVYDYGEKADLRKGYQNPKRKLGVTMHLSEMTKLKFERKCHTFFLF